MKKRVLLYVFSSVLVLFCLYQIKMTVFAEQTGSSPTNGLTSRILTAYNALVAQGTHYGSSAAAGWTNDWGTYWNRIMASAFWTPDGTAVEANVLANTTFYSGNNGRTIRTGTMTARTGDTASSAQAASGGINYFTPLAGYYSGTDRVSATNAQVAALNANLTVGNVASGVNIFGVVGTLPVVNYTQMSLFNWDDYNGTETYGESTWTNTAGTATTGVWKDSRTGLYWSASEGTYTNSFPNGTHTTCGFFSTNPRGNYAGGDSPCGNAINECANLTLAAGGTSSTDWYLPSQQELMQAYIDGMYNQTNTTFASTNYFWSSTEYSGTSSSAWYVFLNNGTTINNGKSNNNYVRCVRRD